MASRRGRFRTKLCRNFALGHCPQGDACNYVHASPDTIQNDPNIHAMLDGGSLMGHGPRPPLASAASPVWSTLSPVTNSSDHPNYQLGPTPFAGTAPDSRIKYRPLSWRTALCRHFVKNKGWCPVGDNCNYIHDLALASFARDDVRNNARRASGHGGRRPNGKGKAGTKHSHCWAYVQGLCHVQDCQYLHPVAVHLFSQHTPCLSWPNCRRGPLCPYKHPEPYISDSPPASPAPAAAASRPPPAGTQSDVPRGAIPYNGMLYFNAQSPVQQRPPQQQQQQQQHQYQQQHRQLPALTIPNMPSQPPMMMSSPWQGWAMPYPPTPMTYVPMIAQHPWQVQDTSPRWPGNSATAPIRPPTLPRFAGPVFSMNTNPFDVIPSPSSPVSSSPNYTYEPIPEHSRGHSLPIPDSELPYIPQKREQQAGHARRVSVTIKGKEDLDALGLDSTSRGRQAWQTHGDRLGRRSWAPSSSSLHGGQGAHTPPALLYGM
ncbi:hypothetical protein VTO73DRAFT_8821 [Trametes versicolor]